jgi:hypothetical protein
MGIFNTIFGGRGSNQGGAYAPFQPIVPPPIGEPPYAGPMVPWFPGTGQAFTVVPATPNGVSPTWSWDATSSATFPTELAITRSSSATYYNSSGLRASATGGTARVGYDPSNVGTLKGLLLEEQRTNIILHSDDCYTASWSVLGSALAQSATNGADGSTKMTSCTVVSLTNNMCTHQPITGTANGVYAYSVDVKQSTVGQVILATNNATAGTNNYVACVFDFTTASFTQTTVGSGGGASLYYTFVIPLPNNIYRIGMVASVPILNDFLIEFARGATGNTYSSDGVISNNTAAVGDSFLFDSATVELLPSSLSLPSAHIVTTTAAVTRSADIVNSTNSTLLAAKGWIAECSNTPSLVAKTLLGVNTITALGEDSSNHLTTADGGTLTSLYTATHSNTYRAGLAWDAAPRVSISLQNGQAITAANTPVTPTTLYFGNTNNGASGFLNGYVRMLACYSALDDTQLASLTSPGTGFAITGGSANAVVAQTLGALVTAATDTVLAQATITQTLGALGQAAPLTVLDQAVTAQTLGALAQAATASAPASATTSETLGALGQTAAATAPIAITVAQALGALTQDPALTHPDTAAAAQTLGAIAQAATGGVINNATAAQTLAALAQAATATATFNLTAAQTLGTLGQAATATALDQGVVSQTLGALSQAAAATHPDSAAVAQNLGALTQATTAGVVDTAAAAQTLGAIVQTATAGAVDTATAAQTLGALAQAATATAPLAVAASQTLGALAQAATGTVTDAGVVAQALGALVQSASGSVVTSASVAQTLGSLAQTAAAHVDVPGALAATQTLGALGQALTGTVLDAATVAQNFGALGQSVAATHADTASVAQTLGAIVQATSGAVIDVAAVSQALGALNQTATATATSSGFQAAQTLGSLVQALTGTAVDAVTVSQALGGLTQTTTGGPVARIGAYSDTLGPLGQAATGGPIARANVAQVLAALSQVATADLPSATVTAGQILGALQQVAASTLPDRILAAQVLGALGQTFRAAQLPRAKIRVSGSVEILPKVAAGALRIGRATIGGSMKKRAV